MWNILIASFLLVGLASSASPTYDHFRLPTSVRPEHYRLEIMTHLNDDKGFEFAGDVHITINAHEDTNNITLHSQNLLTDQKKIIIQSLPERKADPEQCVKDVIVNSKHDYYILMLCKPLVKGAKYLLSVPFKADLNKNLDGYYRSSYLDKESNQTRWLSITQFEPTSARKAFPCFDEPDMKAKFSIVLGHHTNYSAISNMPLVSSKPLNDVENFVLDEFDESVPMSTYLVAYSVNDFFYDEVAMGEDKANVLFRTYARKDAKNQVSFAGEVGPKVLKFYENLFDIKFPMPKIDQIAIPDFSAGAMENWGLVTYRETALLYSTISSDVKNKHRVASVISHELAHQWFGNLVTMKWWSDLWLNEGFATYVASLGVDHLYPEWDSLNEESVDNTLQIFRDDALLSSHPISVNIGHANQIGEIFDSISYSKGSCVIRMMHLFLGNEAFQKGVSNYLKKFSYNNAEQDNLWESLTVTGHETRSIPEDNNMKEIMDSWTLQMGFPVVRVSRNYQDGSVEIDQTRYLLDTEARKRSDVDRCWWVPISYTVQDERAFNVTRPKAWLKCNGQNSVPMKLEMLADADKWIIFNMKMSGLYKVQYDQQNWNMLISTLTGPDFRQIDVMNRALLIDDAFDFAWTGELDYDYTLRLSEYLEQEDQYLPWKAALDSLQKIHRMVRYQPDYEFFKIYVQKSLNPIYHKLGGLNETVPRSERIDTEKHKTMIAGWACLFDVGDCIPRSIEYFKAWQATENPDTENPIPLNLRSVVYCTNAREQKTAVWDFLFLRYKNSNSAAEKQRILAALGCSRDIWVLRRYLDRCFSSETEVIRKQDASTVFVSVARNEIGFHLARDYFFENIEQLQKYFGSESKNLGRLLSSITAQMNTDKEYRLVQEFTENNKAFFKKSLEGVKRSLETIRINTQWRENIFQNMAKRLRLFI